MAFDTAVDKAKLEGAIKATADAIRAKTGGTGLITWDTSRGFASAVSGITGGGSAEEIIAHADIPDYVKSEALRVAQQVQSVRQDNSIIMLAMSDQHHYGAQADAVQYPDKDGIQTDEGNLHAAMAAKILAYALPIDFMAQLGDVTFGNVQTTSALLQSQANDVLSFLRESHKDIPCFHAIGNHDTGIYYHNSMIDAGNTGIYTESGSWLYNNFTALSASDDTVFGGEANGGYCYRDFADKKLRVFLLNTSEALIVNQSDKGTLGSQRKWFADALVNLNSKSDASKWSFVVLCHYPADYGNTMPLSELLKAYVEGTSITIALETGASETVSFSGKNSAKMIAQFHGHVHNFITSKLSTYISGSGVKYDAWRICIPNGQFNRENYYTTVGSYTDINFSQETTYSKTADSAQDTSFVVNVINPSEQKIYSICYGAGVDRVVGYAGTAYYAVTTKLNKVTLTGGAASVEDGKSYTATLSVADGYELNTMTITMGGTDITSTVYSDGAINIPAVTGDIIITARAIFITDCTNQIPISTDADGNIYNGVGYKADTYLSSGADGTKSGIYATGFIPAAIGDTLYCKDVGMQTGQDAHRISFYDANKTHLATLKTSTTAYTGWTYGDDGNIASILVKVSGNNQSTAYVRLCCGYLGDDSIITVNEPIE